MLENLLIGEIVSVHGVRGGLKVKPLTDFPERFRETEAVDVKLPPHSARAKELSHRYKVGYATVSGGSVIIYLEGVEDRNTAELYRGAMLSVPRAQAVELPEDSYYIGDLVGSKVYELTDANEDADAPQETIYEPDRNGAVLLGTLFEVISTGSNDAYGVRTPDHKELYVPAIGDVVKHVDVERGLVFVRLLPGLREVYLGGSDEA